MKQKDVRIGRVYAVKVSGTVQPVKIIRECESRMKWVGAAASGKRQERHGGWVGKNLKTNREVRIASAAKLRFELVRLCDGRWVPNLVEPAISSARFARPVVPANVTPGNSASDECPKCVDPINETTHPDCPNHSKGEQVAFGSLRGGDQFRYGGILWVKTSTDGARPVRGVGEAPLPTSVFGPAVSVLSSNVPPDLQSQIAGIVHDALRCGAD